MAVKIEKKDIKPKCPHCSKLLDKLVEVKQGWFAANHVFCCPFCQKIVGISAGPR